MADEMEGLDLEDETSDSDQDTERLKSALQKERELRKKAEREVRFQRLAREFPSLNEEDLEGVNPDRWRYIAERIYGADAKSATSPERQESQDPEQSPAGDTDPEEEAIRRISANRGLPKDDTPEKIGRDEALKIAKRDPARYAQLRQQGLVDLGVDLVSQGGTVRFTQR